MSTRSATRARDEALAALAARQCGMVNRRQLLEMGFTAEVIGGAVRRHRLLPWHPGVYAVGHRSADPAAGRWAAVLAGGAGTVASHRTAAEVWGLRTPRAVAHVTVLPGNGSRSRRGLVVHRTRLTAEDVGDRAGLPVTTVGRTLVDLGDVARVQEVRGAFVRAEQLRLIDMDEINGALERSTRRRGPAILRGLLRVYDPRWQATRSNLELRALDAVRAAGLPEPEVNAWLDGRWEADLLWRSERLVVEVDGEAVHATAAARSRDALRDRALRGLGYRVLRVPEADLDRPEAVGRRLRGALARRSLPAVRGGSCAPVTHDPPRNRSA